MPAPTIASHARKPGWQTEDLDEEWIDAPLHDTPDDDTSDTLARPFMVHDSPQPEESSIFGRTHVSEPSLMKPGTFQIREDQPAAPIGHFLDGRNRNALKDFFTPLALETMFNPPSPHPSQPPKTSPNPILETSHSNTSTACEGEEDMEFTGGRPNNSNTEMEDEDQDDVILASDIPNLIGFDGRKPSTNYKFTFSATHPGTVETGSPLPTPQGTAPTTDPRLRLFQFQYDTFTREHLSAVVDSIAVHTSESSKSMSPRVSSQDNQCQDLEYSNLRPPKRLKLTPPDEFSVLQNRGLVKLRRDYVGESKYLMQKIKETRSPSMMEIFAEQGSLQTNQETDDQADVKLNGNQNELRSFWSSDSFSAVIPSDSKSQLTFNSAMPSSCLQPSTTHNSFSLHAVYPTSTLTPSMPSSLHSSTLDTQPRSSTYRQQAAELMAQIRTDMAKGKRIFSIETQKEFSACFELAANEPAVQVSITPASPDNTTVIRQSSAHHDVTSSEKQRKPIKPSPRKLLRRLSAADEVDREIAMNKSASETSLIVEPTSETKTMINKVFPFVPADSQLHNPIPQIVEVYHAAIPNTDFLVPPPNVTVPGELNRVVSGGTTTSVETSDSGLTRATTATSSTSLFTARSVSAGSTDSAASFVKHPGPVQITRITPNDVPALPELVGGMRFDRTLMRWVKAHPNKVPQDEGALTVVSEESDDPFRDIESIHSGKLDETAGPLQEAEESDAEMDGDQGNHAIMAATMVNVLSVDSDTDDSFDFDYGSGAVVEVMTGEESHDTISETTDSEVDQLQSDFDQLADILQETREEDEDTILASTHRSSGMEFSAVANIDLPQMNTPVPAHRSNAPPRSVLKNGTGSNRETPQATSKISQTPFLPGHRRSVSFSDGRKDGKIEGLGRDEFEDDEPWSPRPMLPVDVSAPITPSARGKRIAAVLDDLANLNLNEDTSNAKKESNNHIFHSGSRSLPGKDSFSRTIGAASPTNGQANHTYLTECSFGVSHDKLVHIITDIHPYVPHWEQLEEVDLTGKGIESVARLKELLPNLDKVYLNHNGLSWLTGLPSSVRTLNISSNILSSLTSYNHLTNLEYLDISNNEIDSLKQLSCLRHLRELRADGNVITSLEGLEGLDGLVKLSLKGNRIHHISFEEMYWPRLELLNLSRNGLRSLTGLSSLSTLSCLNLDHNQLACFETERSMPRLHTLRISNNRLTRMEGGRLCNIRTLYADNNRLGKVHGLERMKRLENLSLRNQGGQLVLSMKDVRDVKRLYLSGNSLLHSFLQEPCYNLIYLELAGCRLVSLPSNLSRLIPNIRVLNLNYNFLTDARALDGLTRLRKLTLIGSRLKGTKSLIRILKRMPDIEMLDFRMNPCTLGWYLPILVQDIPGVLQPSEDQPYSGDDTSDGTRPGPPKHYLKHNNDMEAAASPSRSHVQSWQELDAKFRGDLPDEAYVGRLAYRGLVMRACPKIKMLDGVVVSSGEKEKAERLLRDVLAAKAEKRVLVE